MIYQFSTPSPLQTKYQFSVISVFDFPEHFFPLATVDQLCAMHPHPNALLVVVKGERSQSICNLSKEHASSA